MGQTATSYQSKSSTEELRLRLPLQQPDGSLAYVEQSIDNFPYYLRTTDYSDYFRLALVQRELSYTSDWLELQELFKSAHFDNRPVSPDEEILIQRAFTIQIKNQ
ncbi:MAG: hypothetical protein ACQETE_12290 [Bacteroidota bacterium]